MAPSSRSTARPTGRWQLHVRRSGATVFRARRIETTSDLDGEAGGRLPIRIEVLPRVLRFRG